VLLYEGIHEETLARTGWAQYKLVPVIDTVGTHGQVGRIDTYGYALPVREPDQEIRFFVTWQCFPEKETKGGIGGGQEPIVFFQFHANARQSAPKQFQLVVGIA